MSTKINALDLLLSFFTSNDKKKFQLSLIPANYDAFGIEVSNIVFCDLLDDLFNA